VCVCVAGGLAAQDCILDAWMKDCSLVDTFRKKKKPLLSDIVMFKFSLWDIAT
jgi:hypothetical protein